MIELFSSIKKGIHTKEVSVPELPIWKAGKLYWLEAVKDVHILDLSWTLPSLRHEYLKKAEDYLAHLLGHGKESAHKLLIFSIRNNEILSHCPFHLFPFFLLGKLSIHLMLFICDPPTLFVREYTVVCLFN